MSSVSDTIRAASAVISGIDAISDRERLLDLVRRLEESEAEVRDLRRRNEALATQLARRKDLERMGGSYFLIERDGSRTGPVCPHCYEESGIVHLLQSVSGEARCLSCGRSYVGVDSPYVARTGSAG